MKLRDLIVPFLAALLVVVMFGTLSLWLVHPEWFEAPPEPLIATRTASTGAGAATAVVRRPKPRHTLPPELVPIQEAYEDERVREVVILVDELEDPPVPALILKAWALYKQGLLERAHETFEEILAEDPNDPDALTGAAYCLLRAGREREAQARFEAALDVDTTREDSLFGLGYAHFRQGHRARAIRFLELGLQRDPTNVEARELLAELRSKAEAAPSPGEPD